MNARRQAKLDRLIAHREELRKKAADRNYEMKDVKKEPLPPRRSEEDTSLSFLTLACFAFFSAGFMLIFPPLGILLFIFLVVMILDSAASKLNK